MKLENLAELFRCFPRAADRDDLLRDIKQVQLAGGVRAECIPHQGPFVGWSVELGELELVIAVLNDAGSRLRHSAVSKDPSRSLKPKTYQLTGRIAPRL